MTTDHLDDQALSAILDGEAPPSPHLDGCDECRSRSEQLLGAARLVGIAVPPPDAQRREDMIARALDSYRPVRARWRPPAGALAAAAVLLAIAALVPLLLTRGGDSDDSAASRLAESQASTTFAGDDASGRSLAAGSGETADAAGLAGPVMAGDLGTIDENELRTRVTEALKRSPKAAADMPITCEDDVRTMDAQAGELVLFGQATVNERAGFVLVFTVKRSDPAKLTAYVVAQDSCAQILQFASFVAP